MWLRRYKIEMGEWKALKKDPGTGWKELERESGTGWKALLWGGELFEDFENIDDWYYVGGSGWFVLSTTQKKAGTYSGRTVGNGDDIRYRKSHSKSLPFTVEIWVYITQCTADTNIDAWFGLNGWGGAYPAVLSGYNSTYWQLYDSAYETTTKACTTGWHKIKVVANADGSGSAYIDDDLLSQSFSAGAIPGSDYLLVRSNGTGYGYWDECYFI